METSTPTLSTLTFRLGEGFSMGAVLVVVTSIEDEIAALNISGDRVGTSYRCQVGRKLPIAGGAVTLREIGVNGSKRVLLAIEHDAVNVPVMARRRPSPRPSPSGRGE